MKPDAITNLSRRERQIMDILFQRGRASVDEVREAMEDAPSYSAVRATLRILEGKQAVTHEETAGKYYYSPAARRGVARKSALRKLVDTFFDGSAAQAAAALLGTPNARFSQEELDRLASLIEKARKEQS